MPKNKLLHCKHMELMKLLSKRHEVNNATLQKLHAVCRLNCGGQKKSKEVHSQPNKVHKLLQLLLMMTSPHRLEIA